MRGLVGFAAISKRRFAETRVRSTTSPIPSPGRKYLLVHLACPTALAMLHASLLAQPLVDRQCESGLAPVAHFGREWGAGGCGENLLAAAFAANEQRREFAQEMRIDERHAHFERMGHARPIHVAQELIPKVKR